MPPGGLSQGVRLLIRSRPFARALAVGALAGVCVTGAAIALGASGSPWMPHAVRQSGTEGIVTSLTPALEPAQLAGLMVAMLACYLLLVGAASALTLRSVMAAVAVMHVLFAAAPLLLSRDAFLYLAHARAAVLGGINPYADAPAQASGDPILQYVYTPWADAPSIYGPLFTVVTYAVAPVGIAGAVWTMKAVLASASFSCVGVVAVAARRLGVSPSVAVALVGLNPVTLVWVVGGAHNDALVGLLLAAAVLLAASGARDARAAAAVVMAAGVKATAGLVLPFVVAGARETREALLGVALCSALLVLGIVLFFDTSGLQSLVTALLDARENVSPQSVPSQVSAVLLGIEPVLPRLHRDGTLIAMAVTVLMLWRTLRGASWVASSGWVVLAWLATSVWMRPWYLAWLLPLAALGGSRRLVAGTLAFTGFMVLAVPLRSHVPEVLRLLLAPGTVPP